MNERARFLWPCVAPGFQQCGVLLRRAFYPAFGAQVSLNVSLRQRVQPAENFRGDRLQAWDDEQQMEIARSLKVPDGIDKIQPFTKGR